MRFVAMRWVAEVGRFERGLLPLVAPARFAPDGVASATPGGYELAHSTAGILNDCLIEGIATGATTVAAVAK